MIEAAVIVNSPRTTGSSSASHDRSTHERSLRRTGNSGGGLVEVDKVTRRIDDEDRDRQPAGEVANQDELDGLLRHGREDAPATRPVASPDMGSGSRDRLLAPGAALTSSSVPVRNGPLFAVEDPSTGEPSARAGFGTDCDGSTPRR